MQRTAAQRTAAGQRIIWADILKFLGMTLIYWGHTGVSSGVTLYIFAHHVPLFFFVSGFFASLTPSEGSFPAFVWKKVRQLVFPYILFSIFFYVLQLATGQMTFSELPKALLVSAAGIRNQAPGPLWFLTCLFVTAIAFELIKRLFSAVFGKSRAAEIFSVVGAAALFAVGIFLLGHEPAQDPRWIWNVDSAFVYIFYYALGALFFPCIRDYRLRKASKAGNFFVFFFFAAAAAFAVFTLLKGEAFTAAVRTVLSEGVSGRLSGDGLFELYAFASAMILIYFEVCISRLLSLIPGIRSFLAYVGRDSLYHCGNELIIKYFAGLAVSALGLQGFFSHDLTLLLYSILCMLVLTFTLNLAERLLFAPLFGTRRLIPRR